MSSATGSAGAASAAAGSAGAGSAGGGSGSGAGSCARALEASNREPTAPSSDRRPARKERRPAHAFGARRSRARLDPLTIIAAIWCPASVMSGECLGCAASHADSSRYRGGSPPSSIDPAERWRSSGLRALRRASFQQRIAGPRCLASRRLIALRSTACATNARERERLPQRAIGKHTTPKMHAGASRFHLRLHEDHGEIHRATRHSGPTEVSGLSLSAAMTLPGHRRRDLGQASMEHRSTS